jgi:hypothetical protein
MTATTEFVVPRSIPMIFSPSATVLLLSESTWGVGSQAPAYPDSMTDH